MEYAICELINGVWVEVGKDRMRSGCPRKGDTFITMKPSGKAGGIIQAYQHMGGEHIIIDPAPEPVYTYDVWFNECPLGAHKMTHDETKSLFRWLRKAKDIEKA